MPLLSLSLLTGGPKLGGVQAQSNNGRVDTMGRTHKVCSATRHTTLRSCGATLEAVVGDALLLMERPVLICKEKIVSQTLLCPTIALTMRTNLSTSTRK